jgi:hypothetical protein
LYGYETWFVTVKEVFRVFESMMLRKIFGPIRDEITVDWRNLHNEELHNLYSPQVILE